MRTFIADIIPKIQKFSQKLDDQTRLMNQHWVSVGEIDTVKRVYIFRSNNQLLISSDGLVERGSWEYLGNQSLLLETKAESYLLKHGFFDESVIALKIDSTDGYAFFVNETKYHKELNTIEDIIAFLENKYLKSKKTGNDLDSNRKETLNTGANFSYEVLSERNEYNLLWGVHITFDIKFSNGIIDNVYHGISSKRYFYFDVAMGKRYCPNFDDAVNRLYNDRFNS